MRIYFGAIFYFKQSEMGLFNTLGSNSRYLSHSRGQFIKTCASAIHKCSYCFQTQKKSYTCKSFI